MRTLAVIIGDEVYNSQGMRIGEPSRAVAAPAHVTVQHLDPIDEFNSHLAQAIRLAQAMSEEDKRRASTFMEAARGMLTAVTRLPADEQRKFEAALRNATPDR